MIRDVLAMIAATAGLFLLFGSRAEAAACLSDTVSMDVATTSDLQSLTDAMDCTGEGYYNVTWYGKIQIDFTIEVFGEKTVTVTGYRAGFDDIHDLSASADAGGSARIFSVSNGSTLKLNHLVLDGGNEDEGGAVAVRDYSSLHVLGCTFVKNSASAGGAIYASRSDVHINGSNSFESNSANIGGAIYADTAKVIIDGSNRFANNSVDYEGGAIHADSHSDLDINGDTYFGHNSAMNGGAISGYISEAHIGGSVHFTQNSAEYDGGAIHMHSNSSVGIAGDIVFGNNFAAGSGGAMFAYGNSSIGINGNASFANNSCQENGGTIFADYHSVLRIRGSTSFADSSAGQHGGVIYASTSVIHINGSTMFSNNSAHVGGAIYADFTNVRIDGNNSFSKNSAYYEGGAIHADYHSDLDIDGDTYFGQNFAMNGGAISGYISEAHIKGKAYFDQNSADYDGGAIHMHSNSSMDIAGDVVFGNNFASGSGGAMFAYGNSSIGISGNASFANNSCQENGGVIYASTSVIHISGSTMFANNSAHVGGAIYADFANAHIGGSNIFSANSAYYEGGVIFASTSDININGTTMFANNSAHAGGAIYADFTNVHIEGSNMFSNNTAYFEGGGICFHYHSELSVDGVTNFGYNSAVIGGAISGDTSQGFIRGNASFAHNFAQDTGGAIYMQLSEVLIDGDSLFAHNSANYSGGAILAGHHTNVSVDGRARFCENSAGDAGGAMSVDYGSNLHIDGNTSFVENSAGSSGGALHITTSNIDIEGNSHFGYNFADWSGGAIFVGESEMNIDGQIVFTSNSALSGGALHATYAEVQFGGDSKFLHNSGQWLGGAVFAEESKYNMVNISLFNSNSAPDGGAIYANMYAEVHIGGTTSFYHNSAVHGGALWSHSAELYIDGNTSFELNSAQAGPEEGSGWGGAIYSSDSVVNIAGSASFRHNSAAFGGGAISVESAANIHINGTTGFYHNSANVSGGAFYSTYSTVHISGYTTFDHSRSPLDGGAMYAVESEVHIAGSTRFAHSETDDSGGAMFAIHSNISIDGNTSFVDNWAASNGGAIAGESSSFVVTGRSSVANNASSNTGMGYPEGASALSSVGSVTFSRNEAVSIGGALWTAGAITLDVNDAVFESNKAGLGGAVYVIGTDQKATEFNACKFDNNQAADGGAIYYYTGAGLDICTTSIFHGNSAKFSGGAIFHTGSLRVIDTSFVANEAGADGPAIMSIGPLGELSNVAFLENIYHCPAGQYSDIVEDDIQNQGGDQSAFCTDCFEEVCARCSTAIVGVTTSDTEIPFDVTIDGKPVCNPQPSGSIAPSSGTTLATLHRVNGYYRTSNQSSAFLQCYRKEACIGGSSATDPCAVGYEGPFCAVCADGYAPGFAFSCQECSGEGDRSIVWLAVAVFVGLLILAGLLFWHLWAMVNVEGHEHMQAAPGSWAQRRRSCRAYLVNMLPLSEVKIIVTVWQIISQFATIAGDVYPDMYKNFVSKLSIINFDLSLLLSYTCILTTDFYDRLLFATIVPPLMLVVLAGSYFVGKKRNSRSESAMRAVLHKHQSVALYLALFVYSSISYTIFQTFACDELDDGEAYLRADYSLTCSTARHGAYRVYAIVMVFVYPVGIPVTFALWLARHRLDLIKTDRETIAHLDPLSDIWSPYKPSRYYFEVVECGRRIALTGIAAFVPRDNTAQIPAVLLFAVVFVFVSEALSPFRKGVNMSLYRWGNGIIVTSMYASLLLRLDIAQDDTRSISAFSGVLIAANVCMAMAVLVQAVLLTKEWRKIKVSVRQVDVPVRRTTSARLGGTLPRIEE